jgi:hypothetical protein
MELKHVLPRFEPPGVVAVGRQGMVLAQTRTRPFDVLPRDNYVAPRALA